MSEVPPPTLVPGPATQVSAPAPAAPGPPGAAPRGPAAGEELLAALRNAGDWLRRRFLQPERPRVAVEVRQSAVGVVRVGRDGRLGAAASLELPPGTLQLSMTQPNILDPVAFRQTLRSVLERAGILGGGGVILVLPDPVARVALVPGAEARSRGRADTEELLRFRLRKAVPFDIREARVDFVRFGQRAEDALLVAAISRPVLEGYEQACAAVGLHPGIVELAGLSLLSAAFPSGAAGDRLLVNWDDGYVSFLLVREERLELARTLAGELAAAPDEVGRELANTDLYYRERLGGAGFAEIVVRTGALPAPHAARVLREALGVEPRVLDALAAAGGGEHAPVSQALAGAASALRRAA